MTWYNPVWNVSPLPGPGDPSRLARAVILQRTADMVEALCSRDRGEQQVLGLAMGKFSGLSLCAGGGAAVGGLAGPGGGGDQATVPAPQHYLAGGGLGMFVGNILDYLDGKLDFLYSVMAYVISRGKCWFNKYGVFKIAGVKTISVAIDPRTGCGVCAV